MEKNTMRFRTAISDFIARTADSVNRAQLASLVQECRRSGMPDEDICSTLCLAVPELQNSANPVALQGEIGTMDTRDDRVAVANNTHKPAYKPTNQPLLEADHKNTNGLPINIDYAKANDDLMSIDLAITNELPISIDYAIKSTKMKSNHKSPIKSKQTTKSPTNSKQTTESPTNSKQTTEYPINSKYTTESPLTIKNTQYLNELDSESDQEFKCAGPIIVVAKKQGSTIKPPVKAMSQTLPKFKVFPVTMI